MGMRERERERAGGRDYEGVQLIVLFISSVLYIRITRANSRWKALSEIFPKSYSSL